MVNGDRAIPSGPCAARCSLLLNLKHLAASIVAAKSVVAKSTIGRCPEYLSVASNDQEDRNTQAGARGPDGAVFLAFGARNEGGLERNAENNIIGRLWVEVETLVFCSDSGTALPMVRVLAATRQTLEDFEREGFSGATRPRASRRGIV